MRVLRNETIRTVSAWLAVPIFAMGVIVASAAPAQAAPIVIGTEDPVLGFTGELFSGYPGAPFPGSTGYTMASDGEANFRPFGATFDTSDGVSLDDDGFDNWQQAADSSWTQIGLHTWVLPAATACGSENEPACELIGHFVAATFWNPGAIGTWAIMDADGSVGDLITTYNDAANHANLTFQSDPLVPEPGSLVLLGTGIGALVYRRRQQVKRS